MNIIMNIFYRGSVVLQILAFIQGIQTKVGDGRVKCNVALVK